jgi:hypothetical protein
MVKYSLLGFQGYKELLLTPRNEFYTKITSKQVTAVQKRTAGDVWPNPPNLGLEFAQTKNHSNIRHINKNTRVGND